MLAQLGNRIQHALRAYTPDDAKALKATASTFPKSEYDLEEVLTQLGTGEAIVTVLNEKGAPRSSMAALDAGTMAAAVGASPLLPKYKDVVDRESAQEMLAARVAASPEPPQKAAPKPEPSMAGKILNSRTTRSVLTAAGTQLIRSIFGTRRRS